MMSSLLWNPRISLVQLRDNQLTRRDKDSTAVGFLALSDDSVNAVWDGGSRSDTNHLVLETNMSVNGGEGRKSLCGLNGRQDGQRDRSGQLISRRDGLAGRDELGHEFVNM